MFKVNVFVRRQRPFDQAQFERRTNQVVATDPERTAYIASAEYKNYIPVMLFVKYISEVWRDHYEQLLTRWGTC